MEFVVFKEEGTEGEGMAYLTNGSHFDFAIFFHKGILNSNCDERTLWYDDELNFWNEVRPATKEEISVYMNNIHDLLEKYKNLGVRNV